MIIYDRQQLNNNTQQEISMIIFVLFKVEENIYLKNLFVLFRLINQQ